MKRSDNATFGAEGDLTAEAPAAERFRVGDELARGGLGRVLRAHDTHLDRVVAIKTLLRTSPAARARFERETRLTARLQHPNVVPVYDGGVDADGTPFLAMRLVTGRTLGAELEARGDLAGRLALLPHVIAACNAVAYAHHQRIAHRDLKPDNLLVGSFGETLVIDWGLAKDLDAADEQATEGEETQSGGSLTRVGTVVGTPAYMPPEQAGGRPVGVAADVYALGAVLYQTLTGRRPYDGAPDVVAAVLAGPPTPIVQLAPGAPRDLVTVAEKAMDRDPGRRYPDAQALASDLERFAAGRFVDAHHYTFVERVRRLIAQNRLASSLAGVMAVGAALSVAALADATRRAEVARDVAVRLRDEDRAQRDAGALAQATLLAERDPRRALELVASISDAFAFDGRVRTVVATAVGAGVPVHLEPPAPGATVGAVIWGAAGPIVAWGDVVVGYGDGPAGRVLHRGVGRLQGLHALGDGLVWCDDDGFHWETGGRAGAAANPVCTTLRPDGAGVSAQTDGAILRLGPDGAEVRVASPTVARHAAGPSGALWVADEAGRIGLLGGAGGPRWLDHLGPVYGLASSGDGAVLAIAGANPAAALVRATPAGLVRTAVPVDAEWTEVVAFVGPTQVALGGGDTSVTLVDTDTGDVRTWPLPGRPRAITGAAGDTLAVSTDEGSVVLVDRHLGPSRVLPIGAEVVTGLAVSPDGAALVAATVDRVVLHRLPDAPTAVGGRVAALLPTADGLWVGGAGGIDHLGGDGARRHVADDVVHDLVACGGQVWAARPDGVLRVVDGVLLPTASPVHALGCDAGRGWLVAGDHAGVVRAYDADGAVRAEVATPVTPPGIVEVVVTPDGRWVLAGSPTVIVADPTAGVVGLVAEIQWSRDVAQSAQGAWVGDDTGRVWELGTPSRQVARWQSGVTSLEAQAGGLLSGHADGSVVWHQGDQSHRLVGHTQYVSVMASRPGGRFVASAGWDDTVWLWDLGTSPPSGRPLRGHADAVVALAWSDDGSTLWSGGQQGEVHAWTDDLPLDGEAVRAEVRRLTAPR